MDRLKEMMIDANTELARRKAKEAHTLYDIALVKSYAYCEEYNSNSGRTTEKHGARFLKEGYIDGFMAGFTHKFTGDTE